MPTLIPREEALRRIIAEAGRPDCLMCAILERRVELPNIPPFMIA